ncbi:MAG: hypothetical protein AAF844_16185 [Pseudomonadota bacterium]
MRDLMIAACMVGLIAAAAPMAAAQTWTRSGPKGSATRTLDRDNGTYTLDRSGVNGGSRTATVDCSRGGGVNCRRDYSLSNADGQTVTGTRKTRYGRYGGGTVNTVTGPEGNTVTRASPTWRYNRARSFGRW